MSNDKAKCRETFLYLNDWIENLRSGKNFEVRFWNHCLPNNITSKRSNDEMLPATLGTTNSMRLGKRYKSTHEYQGRYNKRNVREKVVVKRILGLIH